MSDRNVIQNNRGFGSALIIQEGGWLFGGSATEASMWLDGNGDIHVERCGECSAFVEQQIAEKIAELQAEA